jgi:hypothetical protein
MIAPELKLNLVLLGEPAGRNAFPEDFVQAILTACRDTN